MPKTKHLRFITGVYWFLLLYIVAALLFWLVSLERQNDVVTRLKIEVLSQENPNYEKEVAHIKDVQRRKTIQYLGEGITFLVVILVGAVFVYRSMRRQIRLSRQEKNFMMAVTHELKTPIAVAQLNLETLQKRKLEAEQTSRILSQTLKEVSRLNELCDNILFSAQLDSVGPSAQKMPLSFTRLLVNALQTFKLRYPNVTVVSSIEEDVMTEGDEFALQMLVSNLLENAAKYGGLQSVITVKLSRQENTMHFSVADNGPGVPDKEKTKVFEKFYRAGNENTRVAKGTGLGLYICKRIVSRHGGKIYLLDNAPSGAIVQVEMSLIAKV